MVASSGPQLLIVAGAIIASASPSAVSWLYFANRLIELPLGIVGVAMGTVLVPELTRALRGGDRRGAGAGRIARPRTRGRTGAAGDARVDRAGAADRARAVRAWRLHRRRQRGHRAGADAGWRSACPPMCWSRRCRRRSSPATTPRRRCWRRCRASRSRSSRRFVLGRLFGAGGIAASIALGAWSSALSLIRRGATSFGFSHRCRGAAAAAAHRRGRAVRWARCCGWRRAFAGRRRPRTPTAPRRQRPAGDLIAVGMAIYGLLLACSA